MLARSHFDQAHDPGVLDAPNNREFAEVLVEGREDATFCMGAPEDLLVAGIVGPRTCPDRIMPRAGEVRSRSSADARIEEPLTDWTARR